MAQQYDCKKKLDPGHSQDKKVKIPLVSNLVCKFLPGDGRNIFCLLLQTMVVLLLSKQDEEGAITISDPLKIKHELFYRRQ